VSVQAVNQCGFKFVIDLFGRIINDKGIVLGEVGQVLKQRRMLFLEAMFLKPKRSTAMPSMN